MLIKELNILPAGADGICFDETLQGNQSICHVEEHGEVVLVVEKRRRDDGKEGQVILRVSEDH